MKKTTKWKTVAAGVIAAASVSGIPANAQYYEIANQIPGLIQPALSGSMNYKGFVEMHYLKGLGDYNADFIGISTTQGFKYRDWFYMGVGIGVDLITSHTDENYGNWRPDYPDYANHSSSTTGVLIPIFTDFRFDIGTGSKANIFIDAKIGAAFLAGRDYLQINNGYITNQEYFYLRPTVGVRIPINKEKPKQAIDIGISYQLLTSNYWSSWSRNITLNSLGVNIAYEW